ncbi:MAG: PHP domain-containing protein [Hadesarchaea archaeon]|nr:PHP domain-containing protein [Hadesarchaea archaeon]
MKKRADLHVHTTASNGKIRPEKAVKIAEQEGVAAIAIVDHDTTTGIEPAISATEYHDVEVIPGVEISYEKEDKEAHIMGYFIDKENSSLKHRLTEFQQARRERMMEILEKLEDEGIDVPPQKVFHETGEADVVGRSHIARVMKKMDYVETIDEAFDKYLGYGKPAYTRKFQLELGEIMKLIKDADGVPALAHPKFSNAEDLLPLLIRQGLKAIETSHPTYDEEDVKHFEEIADKYHLIKVGGTDAHGTKPGIGEVTVPYKIVNKLKARR